MKNNIYDTLLNLYDDLDEEAKKDLIIYKSRLFYFINEISSVSNFNDLASSEILSKIKNKEKFIYKYREYKEVINLPINMFIKKSVFSKIDFTDVSTFIDSIKEIPINFSNNALILPNDITVYRIVSGNTTNSISKGNLISTTINPDILDDFVTEKTNHLYKINIKAGTKVLVTKYRVTIDEKEALHVSNNLDNQKEIILFKDSLEIEESMIKANDEELDLYIHTVNTIPKKINTLSGKTL